MTNTVTLDLKDYEDLLIYKKAFTDKKVISKTTYSTYGLPIQKTYCYLVDENEFIKELNEENESNKLKLASFSREIQNEKYRLSNIESKWWYKLFTKFSK